MKSTDRLATLGLLFLVGYVGVLLWHGPKQLPEAFPFFNWSLFSEVPDAQETDYSIRFTSVNGEVLDEPVFFEESQAFLATAVACRRRIRSCSAWAGRSTRISPAGRTSPRNCWIRSG